MRILKIAIIMFILLTLLSCSSTNGWIGRVLNVSAPIDKRVENPEPGHIEVALAGSRGAALSSDAFDMFISAIRNQKFLSCSGLETDDPLAPCALLSAAFVSVFLNQMFAGICHPGTINFFPPAGTSYILGLYDEEMAKGKGSIPRDDPNKAADILARLVIYHSWIFSMKLNTMITPLTQGDCLELLLDDVKFKIAFLKLNYSNAVMTHAAPVSAYISSYNHETGKLLLLELLQSDFLDKPSSSKTNPLSPCSLLGAFRLAARLNETWGKLTNGKFDAGGRPELVQYEEELGDGKTLKTMTPRAAEIFAAVFAAEILRANEITSLLTENCTEADCLDEIFQPGTLRLNLKRQGIEVPLR